MVYNSFPERYNPEISKVIFSERISSSSSYFIKWDYGQKHEAIKKNSELKKPL